MAYISSLIQIHLLQYYNRVITRYCPQYQVERESLVGLE